MNKLPCGIGNNLAVTSIQDSGSRDRGRRRNGSKAIGLSGVEKEGTYGTVSRQKISVILEVDVADFNVK
jgi:hypothetical protein